jgi:hypothetical protein
MVDESRERLGTHYIPEFRKTRFDIPVDANHIVIQGGHRIELAKRNPELMKPEHMIVVVDELDDEEQDVPFLESFFADPDWFSKIDQAQSSGKLYSKAFYAVLPVEYLAETSQKSPANMFDITNNVLNELRQFDPNTVLGNIEHYLQYGQRGLSSVQQLLGEFFAMLDYTAVQLEATHHFYDQANSFAQGREDYEKYSREMRIRESKTGETEQVSVVMMLQRLEARIQEIKNMTAEHDPSSEEEVSVLEKRLSVIQDKVAALLQGQNQ